MFTCNTLARESDAFTPVFGPGRGITDGAHARMIASKQSSLGEARFINSMTNVYNIMHTVGLCCLLSSAPRTNNMAAMLLQDELAEQDYRVVKFGQAVGIQKRNGHAQVRDYGKYMYTNLEELEQRLDVMNADILFLEDFNEFFYGKSGIEEQMLILQQLDKLAKKRSISIYVCINTSWRDAKVVAKAINTSSIVIDTTCDVGEEEIIFHSRIRKSSQFTHKQYPDAFGIYDEYNRPHVRFKVSA